ncbi:hypothetical protein [Desulfosoma caldarium]|uniref:hypothetical protein n=1 Tax=Desulfosoma caldarium TaxID=610254 RepID=UPI00147301D0|nr:hypothetical protein [Desulfosoma caldarium]
MRTTSPLVVATLILKVVRGQILDDDGLSFRRDGGIVDEFPGSFSPVSELQPKRTTPLKAPTTKASLSILSLYSA